MHTDPASLLPGDSSAPIWINAGELSGDMHGAMLLEALRRKDSSLSFIGMGGEHLRKAGLEALFSFKVR